MGICVPTTNCSALKKEEFILQELQGKQIRGGTLTMSDQEYLAKIDAWLKESNFYKGEILFSTDEFLKLYFDYMNYQNHYIPNFTGISLHPDPPPRIGDQSRGDKNLTKIRYLIRKGVQLSLYRTLVKNKFLVNWREFEETYQIIKQVVFQECPQSSIRLVPTFSELTLPQVLQVHCLNSSGKNTIKIILWVVKENFPILEYNPMIVQIIQLLLLFFNEWESYLIIKSMIEDSARKLDRRNQVNSAIMRDLRWYFTFNSSDYTKNAQLFFEVASERNPQFHQILNHLQSVKFDYIEQFNQWTKSFFTNIVQFSTVLRLLAIFINEGIRSIYKFSFGIWMTLKDQVLLKKTKEEISELLRNSKIDNSIDATDALFQKAYTLKIKKPNKSFQDITLSTFFPQLNIIYRPKTKEKSQIISYDQLEGIWDWIPSSYKISNPSLIYSTFKDGFLYQTLIHRASQNIDYPMLLIIQTSKQKVLGVFSETMIRIGHGDSHYGTDQTFVFTLVPKEQAFTPTYKNTHYITTNQQQFSFGLGEEGPALSVTAELNGMSNASDTFGNEQLHGEGDKHFAIRNIELYSLLS